MLDVYAERDGAKGRRDYVENRLGARTMRAEWNTQVGYGESAGSHGNSTHRTSRAPSSAPRRRTASANFDYLQDVEPAPTASRLTTLKAERQTGRVLNRVSSRVESQEQVSGCGRGPGRCPWCSARRPVRWVPGINPPDPSDAPRSHEAAHVCKVKQQDISREAGRHTPDVVGTLWLHPIDEHVSAFRFTSRLLTLGFHLDLLVCVGWVTN